jgi:hypothetical protein
MSRRTQQEFLSLAETWIARATDDRGLAWYRSTIDGVARAPDDRARGIAIGQAPRRLGRAALALGNDDLARAGALRPGLDPRDWSVDQLARIALMLAGHRDDAGFAATFDRFCATAEINELIALCRGLPLYPAPDLIEPRAREALRSGMKPVFEAVAHNNPYPSEVFADDDWNQMVVKAIFIGATLWPIQGLDRRSNPQLARMLVALLHERRAAGRPISAEVWRCIVPHADDEERAAMLRTWDDGDNAHRRAIALALKRTPEAAAGLPFGNRVAVVEAELVAQKIGWPDLA